MRRIAGILLVPLIGVLVALGVVGAIALRDESIRSVETAAQPEWMPVAPAPGALVETRKFAVERSTTVELPAGSWQGTITAVDVSVGDVLDPAAAAPVTVDGHARP